MICTVGQSDQSAGGGCYPGFKWIEPGVKTPLPEMKRFYPRLNRFYPQLKSFDPRTALSVRGWMAFIGGSDDLNLGSNGLIWG
jgi:hypothetical protein